jgi:hypothetical protein
VIQRSSCALDIINTDEAQFKRSPISFFGVLMTVATQAIIANRPALKSDHSHPSTRARIAFAKDRVLGYIGRANIDAAQRYAATISGTAEYFDALLSRLAIAP